MGRNILRGRQRDSLKKFTGLASVGLVVLVATTALAEESGLGSEGARGARWQQSTVTLNVEASVDLLGGSAFDAVVASSTTWENSPGELPTVVVVRGPDDEIGYRRTGANLNTVRYSRDGDPMANGALAITVITFDATAKKILDADIVLNGDHRFGFFNEGKNITGVVYDLQNVLTHEMGHFFGLGEEFYDENATMYAYSQAGETGKRDLGEIDLEEITSLYDEAYVPREIPGCAGATLAGYSGESWSWGLLWLATLGFLMRRRSTREFAKGLASLTVLFGLLSGSQVGAERVAHKVSKSSGSNPLVVVGSRSSWQDGLIVTKLSLQGERAGRIEHSTVLGGQVGDLVQVVGKLLPPRIGEKVRRVNGRWVVAEPMGGRRR